MGLRLCQTRGLVSDVEAGSALMQREREGQAANSQ